MEGKKAKKLWWPGNQEQKGFNKEGVVCDLFKNNRVCVVCVHARV